MTLFLVQDVPTPHNNLVASELAEAMEGELVQVYAFSKSQDYGFRRGLISNESKVILTGARFPHFGLLLKAVFDLNALWVVVGWSNPTSRALLLIFLVTRRHFVFWMDEPLPRGHSRSFNFRGAVLLVLRCSRAKIAAVGLPAMRYFVQRGFPERRVRNIPVTLERPSATVSVRSIAVQKWLSAPFSLLFGSRLAWEKGADILVDALSLLHKETKRQVSLLIVGRGPKEKEIRAQTQCLGLEKQVVFIDWVEFEELVWLADHADLIVAPSRFDSYSGAALLAMITGKPFIASGSVGAALDFINRGVSVPIFPSGNAAALAELLEDFTDGVLNLDDERKQLSALARKLTPKIVAHELLLLLDVQSDRNRR